MDRPSSGSICILLLLMSDNAQISYNRLCVPYGLAGKDRKRDIQVKDMVLGINP